MLMNTESGVGSFQGIHLIQILILSSVQHIGFQCSFIAVISSVDQILPIFPLKYSIMISRLALDLIQHVKMYFSV